MSTFKRHLPPATDIHSMHVAINRIWDAIEAGGTSSSAPSATRILGGGVATFSSGTPSGALTVHNALSGLQGGDTDNYWHLTSAEYTGTGTGVFVRINSPALTGSPTAPTQAKADNSTLMATTAWVKLQGYQPQPANDLSGEMTGFTDPENTIVTYDSAARTITLTGTIEAYFQGEVVTALVPGWVSPPHDATVGTWFLFYDGASFVWQNTSWTFDQLMIAFVNYGASDKFAIRETHGLMDWRSHEEFHRTIGTYLEAGGDIGGYTLASTTAASRRPSVSPASIHDEDIHTTLPALADDGPYTQLYLTSTGTSTFAVAAAEIVPVLANNPYYNLFSTPNWTQTLMSNNSYMTVWLVAVPTADDSTSQGYRFLWMQGQTNGSLASQQAYQFSSMNLGQLATLFTEFVAIGKVIIRYKGGNWELRSVEKITGTRLSNVTAPAGNYLSSVAVTAPLTGTGTGADPIALTYTPINVTGSRGGNAALASLLTALASHGLITDSTT